MPRAIISRDCTCKHAARDHEQEKGSQCYAEFCICMKYSPVAAPKCWCGSDKFRQPHDHFYQPIKSNLD